MTRLSIGIFALVLLLVVMWLVSVARRRGPRSDRARAMPTASRYRLCASGKHHGQHESPRASP